MDCKHCSKSCYDTGCNNKDFKKYTLADKFVDVKNSRDRWREVALKFLNLNYVSGDFKKSEIWEDACEAFWKADDEDLKEYRDSIDN